MSPHLVLLFIAMLLGSPRSVPAESPVPLPAPTYDIPFDEDDPAVMQAEVTQQIAKFLETVQAHAGHGEEALVGLVSGLLERQDHGTLVFTRRIADHPVLEGYEFREGSLVRGQYVFLQRPVNGLNEFIDYYAAAKHSLTAAYGPPVQDHIVWDNDLYQPLPDYWGIAVQIGHLRYAAMWKTAEGAITMELTGNHHSRLTIEYRSRSFIEDAKTT